MLHSVYSPRHAARPLAGVVATLLMLGLMAAPASAATPSTVTIQDPGSPTAGPVELLGSVSAGSLTTTVLYAVDASLSTAHPDGLDCDGSGAFTPGRDNVNGDNSAGDVLDCEIGAVLSLNSTLATSPGSPLVALETFYGTVAASVELAPGTATPALIAPGARDAAGQSVVDTRARELRRPDPSVTGTSFDRAVETALATLSSAPAGPKWIIFLSDGQGQVGDSTITALRGSGVNLRSFAPGSPDGCEGSLTTLAAATGQDCVAVSPAGLSAALGTTQADNVAAVAVQIGSQTFAATTDVAGGWRTTLSIGVGTYTAKVTATLRSGATVSAERMFSVAAPPPGTQAATAAPTPGSVSGTAVSAGDITVTRPAPMRAALPKTVSGRVGARQVGAAPAATAALNGATVLLQGRRVTGPWRTIARTTASGGAYTLGWSPRVVVRSLRVVLLPRAGYTGASREVPRAGISSCRTTRTKARWTTTCRTTAANGSRARLLAAGRVVLKTTVAKGQVTVTGRGRASTYVLVVRSGSRQLRLRL